ncbi:extracellular solute-binding protein [Halalkalibacter sp. APA_J-10(15)]|uniref:extracellular solute-binding protein n=1 Tax=Halalkalibacter sp. APA_J-10(15) TaxID=2933805 RepID=UPI001FF69FFF|nr:extracellular solute-binding protein [Halalkalibacter sp. APA_J-10(15)]MCK0472290.1 extracellular solute-binding protein [Halalkalibacter sp. APA_J-10(15)]
MLKENLFKDLMFLVVFLLGLLIMFGCGSQVNTDEAVAEKEDSPNMKSSSAESITSEEPLIVYANDFTDEIGPLFEEETGYQVEVIHGGGGEILARVEAEQGNPQWDVIWMDGHASLHSLADRGMFLEGWEPENLSQLSTEGESFLPSTNAYFPTGIHAAATLAYNKDAFTAETAPTTWEEFFQLSDIVGMADPGVAAPAYPVASWFFYDMGMDEAKAMFDETFQENRLRVYPKNGPLGSALVNGEIKAAALQEHNSYGLKLNGENIEIIWPEEGVPGSVRVAAIGEHSENIEIAKAFVEFLLDMETQNQLTQMDDTDSFFTPLAEGATVRPDREVNPNIVVPDVEWASEHEAEIKQWFADRAVQ